MELNERYLKQIKKHGQGVDTSLEIVEINPALIRENEVLKQRLHKNVDWKQTQTELVEMTDETEYPLCESDSSPLEHFTVEINGGRVVSSVVRERSKAPE